MLTTLIVLSCITVVATNVPKFNELDYRDFFSNYPSILRLAGLLLTTSSALGLIYAKLSGYDGYTATLITCFFVGHAASSMWAAKVFPAKGHTA